MAERDIKLEMARIVQQLDNRIEKASDLLGGTFVILMAIVLFVIYGIEDMSFWSGIIPGIIVGFILLMIIGFMITGAERSYAKKAAKKIDNLFPYGSPVRREATQFLSTMQETKNKALEKLSQILTDVAFNLQDTSPPPPEETLKQQNIPIPNTPPQAPVNPTPQPKPKSRKYIPLEIEEE